MPRIYLFRSNDGIALMLVNEVHPTTPVSVGQYVRNSIDRKKKLIKSHQVKLSQPTSITKLAENFAPSCRYKKINTTLGHLLPNSTGPFEFPSKIVKPALKHRFFLLRL